MSEAQQLTVECQPASSQTDLLCWLSIGHHCPPSCSRVPALFPCPFTSHKARRLHASLQSCCLLLLPPSVPWTVGYKSLLASSLSPKLEASVFIKTLISLGFCAAEIPLLTFYCPWDQVRNLHHSQAPASSLPVSAHCLQPLGFWNLLVVFTSEEVCSQLCPLSGILTHYRPTCPPGSLLPPRLCGALLPFPHLLGVSLAT